MAILRRAARTAGRTALITSVATKTHQNVASRQRGVAAQQSAQAPAPAPPAPAPSAPPAAPAAPAVPAPGAATQTMIDQLRQLGELRDAGILTTDEFEAQKAAVLAGPTHG